MHNNYILPLEIHTMNNTTTIDNDTIDDLEYLQNSNKMEYLLSCKTGNFNKVSKIINEKNLDIDTRAFNGDTGLMIAIYNEHWDIAIFLIDNSADVNCYNAFRNTPLILACKKVKSEDLSIIEKLVQNGANRKWSNNFLETPKKIAIQRNMGKLLELLK
jgi:ankyrin repeat protein